MESSSIQKLQNCSTGSDGVPVDRLSNLPESIICHILSFLPTKYSVATSLLSKRWEFMWTQVATLDFRDDENDGNQGFANGAQLMMNFVHFVNRVLLLRNAGSLEKFRLRWMRKCQAVCVNSWVSHAIARNVALLDLHILDPDGSDDYAIQLPRALLTCRALESLKLDGPFSIKVPTWFCLPKLLVLELCAVRYESDEAFFKLISGCQALHSLKIQRKHLVDGVVVCSISSPALRRLQINCCVDCWCREEFDAAYRTLKIDAPALEYFSLHDGIPVGFSVQRLTSVNEVDLGTIPLCISYAPYGDESDDEYVAYRCNLVVELVQAIDSVKFMKLSRDIMMALSHPTARMSANFERLTKLVIQCDCSFEWRSLMELLVCSVKLEVLDITFIRIGDHTDRACWRDPKQIPRCMAHSLTRVSFSGFYGLEDEMAMIRFILKHALVMRRVDLRSTAGPRDFKKKFGVLKKISMFPRASCTCKISFS